MNNAYKNMRNFWLFETLRDAKARFPVLGDNKISVAGMEFCMYDGSNVIKNIFAAASTLKDCSMYFENNSPSGLGGMLGGSDKEKFNPAAEALLGAAAAVSGQMEIVKDLPEAKLYHTTFFAASKHHLHAVQLSNEECTKRENPFFNFFICAQNLITVFRQTDEKDRK